MSNRKGKTKPRKKPGNANTILNPLFLSIFSNDSLYALELKLDFKLKLSFSGSILKATSIGAVDMNAVSEQVKRTLVKRTREGVVML